MIDRDYIVRRIDYLLSELMDVFPGVIIVGPRATGKSTTAKRHVKTVIQLDSRVQAAEFRADPDAALLELEEPVLFDEWQEVPEILGALKRSIDVDYRPGRFLLAGSVTAALDQATWPGTGRISQAEMFGLTIGEQRENPQTDFVSRLESGFTEMFPVLSNPPTLREYVRLALNSGFPEAWRLSDIQKRRWLSDYLRNIVSKDAIPHGSRRDPGLAMRTFQAIASTMATSTTEIAIYRSVGVARDTYLAYERMLEDIRAIQLVPGWSANHLSRLRQAPKRYIVDSALGVVALGQNLEGVMADGDLLGKVLDNFVLSQIRPEIAGSASVLGVFHVRHESGRHEVDLLFEIAGRGVIALEVMATAAPSINDARHLIWLKSQLGDRFITGAVLHTGPRSFQLAERILALPIYSIWHGPNASQNATVGGPNPTGSTKGAQG